MKKVSVENIFSSTLEDIFEKKKIEAYNAIWSIQVTISFGSFAMSLISVKWFTLMICTWMLNLPSLRYTFFPDDSFYVDYLPCTKNGVNVHLFQRLYLFEATKLYKFLCLFLFSRRKILPSWRGSRFFFSKIFF